MQLKYIFKKHIENNELIIEEIGEISPGIFSLLYTQKYDYNNIKNMILEGNKKKIFSSLRTKNFFPATVFSDRIVDAIIDLYQSDDKEKVEIKFNDLDFVVKEENTAKEEVEIKAEKIEGPDIPKVDDLLETDSKDSKVSKDAEEATSSTKD